MAAAWSGEKRLSALWIPGADEIAPLLRFSPCQEWINGRGGGGKNQMPTIWQTGAFLSATGG